MRLLLNLLKALRKDYAIISKYLRLQSELQSESTALNFLDNILTIVIGLPLVLIGIVFICAESLLAIILFSIMRIAQRIFGQDIVGWMQEQMK